jgi:hypothetical protein
MSTEDVKNTLLNLVSQFTTRVDDDEKTIRSLEAQGHKVTWEQIQEAYGIAQRILAPTNQTAYEAILTDCGIPKATEKSNRWLPVTKLLYGRWNSARTEFVLNRSAEKYACSFRYFETNGIPASGVAAYVEAFNDPQHGAHLKGIEAADRATNGRTKDDAKIDRLKRIGLSRVNPDVVRIKRPDCVPTGKQNGFLWFEVEGDEIVVLGYDEIKIQQFDQLALRKGRKIEADKRAKADAEVDAIASGGSSNEVSQAA